MTMRVAGWMALIVLLLSLVQVGAAQAGTSEFSHTYATSRSSSLGFVQRTANADFSAQYSVSARRLVWGYKLPQALRQRSATGKMDCKAGHIQLPYSDSHPGIPADYLLHSSIPGHQLNTNYILWVSCRVMVWEPGGNFGIADVGLNFNYRIQNR